LDKAVGYWLKAGRRAVQRSANVEAIVHLRKGIAGLTALPDSPDRDRQELAIQLDLGLALYLTCGWNAPDAKCAYERACELAQRLGDDRRRFQAVLGLWTGNTSRNSYDVGRNFSVELFRIAERLDDPELCLQAHRSAWITAIATAELSAAEDHIQRGMALYDPDKRAHAFLYFGHDAGVSGHGYNGIAQWLRGFPDQAAQSAMQAICLGGRLFHATSLAHALFLAAIVQYFRHDGAAVLQCSERLLPIADEQRLTFYGAAARVLRGWAIVERGDAEHGLVELRRGLDAFVATNSKMFACCLHSALAESYRHTGNMETGLAASQGALETIAGGAERFWKAAALNVRGDLLLAAGRQEEGVTCLQQAIEVAREQGARSLELRAATSLSRRWRYQGQHHKARDLLAPIYGWFTEGFDTPDLKDARALLDELQ
jgi:tetratricopeptide (TPR) repeat protein